jgi:predicted nucleic acid-binding protein
MKKSVYLESSIISYLTAKPSNNVIAAARQVITADWWDYSRAQFSVFVSDVVLHELSQGDEVSVRKNLSVVTEFAALRTTPEAKRLANKLIQAKAITPSGANDALHIAIAALNSADFLLTWNFKHIHNATMRSLITQTIEFEGIVCPVFCSPQQLSYVTMLSDPIVNELRAHQAAFGAKHGNDLTRMVKSLQGDP